MMRDYGSEKPYFQKRSKWGDWAILGGLSDEDGLNDKEGFMPVYLENSSSEGKGKYLE